MERDRSKPWDIRDRTYQYALRAVRVYAALEEGKRGPWSVLGKQYLRAATSIGANVEEAKAAESKADFIHKMGIAQKEARESLYWLKLIRDTDGLSATLLAEIVAETEEIVSVITAIIVNTKRRSKKLQNSEFTIQNSTEEGVRR